MNTKLFRHDNTQGYTDEQLDALNDEWESICETEGLDYDGDYYAYTIREKQFCDEVSQRQIVPDDMVDNGDGTMSPADCTPVYPIIR